MGETYTGGYPAHPNEIHSSPVHALIAQLRAERDEKEVSYLRERVEAVAEEHRCPEKVEVLVYRPNGTNYRVDVRCGYPAGHRRSPYTRAHVFELEYPQVPDDVPESDYRPAPNGGGPCVRAGKEGGA
jgi:hypothetical protein